jgi:hypothetical protein
MPNKGTMSNIETLNAVYHMVIEPPVLQQAEARQTRILDANYEAVNIMEYVMAQDHLNETEKQQLISVLGRHTEIFQGGLGTLKIKPVRLELKAGAQPYHARPFPVPKAYEQTTKKEIDRLTKVGVLQRNSNSEWAAPTFIQPKKTGDVRVLTDFRRLNAVLKRKPFPLPKITDILQNLEGFQYATAIDLSMGYYHIPLDEFSQQLCTMILPWGKYRYIRLPMGIKNSPDIFQMVMSDLLGDLDYARVYIDDILVTSSGTFDDHLDKLHEVLTRLECAGFRGNVRKCTFAKHELEYLGFWVTRQGIQPQPKKVEAIQRLARPKTKRQLRHFLGMVNYYRDMWRRRSHILAPLTSLSGTKAKWQWGTEQQRAFDEVKRVMSREAILSFPDFTKEFHIYTDASEYQLGAVIMQEGKPIAFYSRKLNSAQRRYTTGEQELLSIVETLKEFKNILLGQRLIVHTDHKNLLYEKMASDRVMRWRLLIEEYGPEFQHVAGEKNVVADALSRLAANFETEVDNKPDASYMAHAFVNTTEIEEHEFPMSPKVIAKYQKTDKILRKAVTTGRSQKYSTQKLEGQELITYDGKIYIPEQLQTSCGLVP